MMHDFLAHNRDELIARCKAKVSQRPMPHLSDDQLNGIPLFLDQLIQTLAAEGRHQRQAALKISGGSGGVRLAPSEIGVSAKAHGAALLGLGFSVDEVVHNYGDLCQAVTELAHERDALFSVDEFRTLNRCLDNAIADAVAEFSSQRDEAIFEKLTSTANERLGFLVHELRNSLQLAYLSARAMELGGLTFMGATGSVLKRSLKDMRSLVDGALADVRENSGAPVPLTLFLVAAFIQEARLAAQFEAPTRGCVLVVEPVDPALRLEANRDLLLGALANLLSNAFKFTHSNTKISLRAYLTDDRLRIDVEDRCGGLPPNHLEMMFKPFSQIGTDKTGLGLGLSIARQNIEHMGGTLTVRNEPAVGCVFTIEFPNSTVDERSDEPSP